MDRIFYEEINRRIGVSDKANEIRDVIFLDALGKHVVHRIASPLRKIGIPAACIYDLDVLRNEGGARRLWKNILRELNVPTYDIESLEYERGKLAEEIQAIKQQGGNDIFRKLGVSGLTGYVRTNAINLLNKLKEYGVFIVPVGSVENWLSNLNVQEHNEKWITQILNKLEDYNIKPMDNDVWQFIQEINSWIKNPNCLGMRQ